MDEKHRSDELARLVDQCVSQARRVDSRSALVGGALGLLLSSRHGRGVLGKALKYGVVAGLGAMAWQVRNERDGSPAQADALPLASAVDDDGVADDAITRGDDVDRPRPPTL